MTYRAQDTHIDNALSPFTWYKELVLTGCRLHGFPDTYIRKIEAVEAVNDPDFERHAHYQRLLEVLKAWFLYS